MDNRFDTNSAGYAVYIASLIYKRQENEPLAEDETSAITEWSARGDNLSALGQLMDRSIVSNELQKLDKYDSNKAFIEIVSQLDKKKRIHIWRRSIAAAALIIALSATFIHQWNGDAQRQKDQTIARQIPPAKDNNNKAVLTLEDGRRIELDTASNGELARQNDLSIQKSSGQITYIDKDLLHSDPASNAANAYNTMSTPKGTTFSLVLPDGTKVWLNTASSIRYPTHMDKMTRTVELKGEAFFDVAKNAQSPFIVKTGKMETTVLGTEFNIMAYDDETEEKATLVSGSVRVSAGGQQQLLQPGQQANVRTGGPIQKDDHADIEKAIAWRDGFFQFSHADIKTIMRETARWYNVDIKYELTDFSRTYGGRISRDLDLPGFINLLEGNGILHYKLDGRLLTVLP